MRLSSPLGLAVVATSLALVACGSSTPPAHGDAGFPDAGTHHIQTVFLILMENHNWSAIAGSGSAPYINGTLLPESSYATQYYNPPGNHPSEPNYIWLEAGDNLGITDDSSPSSNHQGTTDHLVTYLEKAGVTWRSYQEGIDGTQCPLTSNSATLYAPKHNPMVYFDDVTGGNDAGSQECITHVRPYSELAQDLDAGTVARYNFITPNLCDDMHNSSGCATSDSVQNGDTWLSQNVPQILGSSAYQDGGVLMITWDEGEGGDGPIGMIVLSPLAKGGGYNNAVHYDHSSTLKTVQEIFDAPPLLRHAGDPDVNDLSDLFSTFP